MAGAPLAWSETPPGLHPVDVPQFVALTFDDNFVAEGMTWATDFFRPLHNPAGTGYAGSFDGSPVRTTFFDNCVYLQDESTRESWRTSVSDGHEIGNHTVSHAQGAAFTAEQWANEIAPCTSALVSPEGLGIPSSALRGFRAPYLGYGPELFGVLASQGLKYDSSVQSCWGPAADGKRCSWPYTLDQGSPDALAVSARFATPTVPAASGLWEVPVSTLFVPPDELAAHYGFSPGLRQRIPTDMAAPSYYDAASGRIAGLDVTLFVDAGLSAPEVLATLKYTLDLRLQGNRSPLVFVGHTHVYAGNYDAAANAPSAAERQGALESFVEYALAKPMVRLRPVGDIVTWMDAPEPLAGVVTMLPQGGAGGGGGSAGASAGASGSAGATGGVGGTAPAAQTGGVSSAGAALAGGTQQPATTSPEAASCACRVPGPQWEAHGGAGVSALLLLALCWARRRAARM